MIGFYCGIILIMKNNIFKKFNENEDFRNKVILGVVIIIGIGALVFNFKNLNNIMANSLKDKDKESLEKMYSIYDELKNSGKLVDDTNSVVTDNSSNNTNTNNIAIQNDGKDTDGDGISDYDEVNIFGTSMYLKDSDGDGITDDQEIKNGTDPNCAEGTSCNVMTATNVTHSNFSYGYGVSSLDLNSLDISKIREELKKMVPDNIKEMIDTMTDDQVKTLMQQLYDTQMAYGNNSAIVNNSTDYINELKSKLPEFTPQQISMMKDMYESEIVDILVESGIVDRAFLSQFKLGEIKDTVLGDN